MKSPGTSLETVRFCRRSRLLAWGLQASASTWTGGLVRLAVGLLGVSVAVAQDYQIGTFSIRTGSGVPSGEGLAVPGGISFGSGEAAADNDQQLVGKVRSGTFTPEGEVVLRLLVVRTAGEYEISWQASGPGYRLESASSLAEPVWETVTSPPLPLVTEHNRYVVRVPAGETSRFFRLRWGLAEWDEQYPE